MSNFPAFPFEYHNQTRDYQKSFVTDKMLPPDASEQYSGLSARDYFAAKALPVVAERFNFKHAYEDEAYIAVESFKSIATDAYLMADAMLAAREGV